jgi:leucyl aminopeptidase
MTNDQNWCDDLTRAAAVSGEQVWQLPMFKEFGTELQSKVADLRNIGTGRWGGAITAGKFLEQFVSEVSWTHMDIAGPAFADSPKKWVDGGASGVMVRTLIEVIRQLEK